MLMIKGSCLLHYNEVTRLVVKPLFMDKHILLFCLLRH